MIDGWDLFSFESGTDLVSYWPELCLKNFFYRKKRMLGAETYNPSDPFNILSSTTIATTHSPFFPASRQTLTLAHSLSSSTCLYSLQWETHT